MSYSRVLAHYPYVILAAVSLFAATCLVVIFTIGIKPDFSDPRAGFEPRGTDISDRKLSFEKLLDETQTEWGKYPYRPHNKIRTKPPKQHTEFDSHRLANDSHQAEGKFRSQGHGRKSRPKRRKGRDHQDFFCDVPRKEYVRLVFRSEDGGTLFTADRIMDMCHMDARIRQHAIFEDICTHTKTDSCCQSWSLGNYVALLANKTSCVNITEMDVEYVLDLLTSCAGFYHNLTLMPNCAAEMLDENISENPYMAYQKSDKCRAVPLKCKQNNGVYYILHYITDAQFLRQINGKVSQHLTYAMNLLPAAQGLSTVDLYKSIEKDSYTEGSVQIIAMNFGIKQQLFDDYLLTDVVWFGAAVSVIFLFMWLYTSSLFVTIMSIVSIFISLIIAYFLYTMVFEIKFFPYMNIMTVVILIGVGADDVFIYCKVWTLAKAEKNIGTLEKIISDTLKHASLSMFVTSLTTAAAFYSNYVSKITALGCFSIFAGTAIMINFLMMVTWIPAVIVVHEKWCSNWCLCYSPDIYTPRRSLCYYLCAIPYKAYHFITDWSRIFFEKILPCIVVKLRLIWLTVYGCMGICGIVVIFYYPKLKLPSSNEFQMFAWSHPFEIYDFQVKDQFWFEKAAGGAIPTMPLQFVWGVLPIDNGKKLNPHKKGTIVYDPLFNLASPEVQQWMVEFCRNLRANKYYQRSTGVELTNCFIEHFKLFMDQKCVDAGGKDWEPCCDKSPFPYKPQVFRVCLRKWVSLLTSSKLMYSANKMAGPRFTKESDNLVALIVEFDSKEPFSYNYHVMRKFYMHTNQWMNEQLLHAPRDMRRGWFISELAFFDLQDAIAQGTPIAIGLSIAIAALVAFLTTLNFLISVFAIVSIACTIFVTIGSLTLLGWELNILESVTISVAVGLSIDFTLHYGVAYRLSPDLDREMRVVCSLSRMGSPVAMAALTTFLAGALIMPSTIMAYRQLGTFLMLIMSISWLYATFFFQSLLRLLGPQGGFGQFHWPTSDCCSGNQREHVDKTIYAMSESTLSSSSTTNHANSSETHELEPLTDRDPHNPRFKGSVKGARRLSSTGSTASPKRDSIVTLVTGPGRSKHATNSYDANSNKKTVDAQTSSPLLSSNSYKKAVSVDEDNEIWVKRPDLL